MKILEFFSNICYEIDCAIDKLYGLEVRKKGGCDLDLWRRNDKKEREWREKHPVIDYFISLYHSFVYTLPREIDMFPRRVYWFIQRGRRGYSDLDCWNFHNYLARVISEGTEQLRKQKTGYPTELTPKKWDTILKKISEGFELIQEDRMGYTTIEDYNKDEKFIKRMKRKKENRKFFPSKSNVKKVEKGFNLFSKYFAHLWD